MVSQVHGNPVTGKARGRSARGSLPIALSEDSHFPLLLVRTATVSKIRKGMDDVRTGHVRTNKRFPKEKMQNVKK